MNFFLFFLFSFLMSCQSPLKNSNEFTYQKATSSVAQLNKNILSAFEKMETEPKEALNLFLALSKESEYSITEKLYIQMGLGRSYHLEKNFSMALKILTELHLKQDLLDKPSQINLKFYLADTYQELGDINRYLSLLKELESFELSIEEKFLLENKKAIAYIQLNQTKDLNDTKEKLAKLDTILSSQLHSKKLSKLYYEASLISDIFFQDHSFQNLIQIKNWCYRWRAYSLMENDSQWSEISLRQTEQDWKKTWKLIENPKVPTQLQIQLRKKEQSKVKKERISISLDAINLFQLQFNAPFPNLENTFETALFSFTESTKEALTHLFQQTVSEEKPTRSKPIKQPEPVLPTPESLESSPSP